MLQFSFETATIRGAYFPTKNRVQQLCMESVVTPTVLYKKDNAGHDGDLLGMVSAVINV